MSGWASSYRRIRKFNDTITRAKLRVEQYVEKNCLPRYFQNNTKTKRIEAQSLVNPDVEGKIERIALALSFALRTERKHRSVYLRKALNGVGILINLFLKNQSRNHHKC